MAAEFRLTCPTPLASGDVIEMAHGGGGRLSRALVEQLFLATFDAAAAKARHDSAVLAVNAGRVVLTTDAYVVRPLFFPGGDIGRLAVFGTVTALSMAGARPLALSAAFVLEEGLATGELVRVAESMRRACDEAGVLWGRAEGMTPFHCRRASLRIGLVSGLIFFHVFFLFSAPVARSLFFMPEIEAPLKVISFFVPFSVLVQVTVGILRGRGFVWPQVYQGLGQSFFFLCTVSIFFFLDLPFISIMYAYLLSIVLVLFTVSCFWHKEVRFRFLSLGDGPHHYALLRFSFPLLVVNMTGVVLAWTDTFMLVRYTDAASVGVYNVSTALARLLEFPIAALAFVFMPIAGELFAKKQFVELKRTYQVLTKWIFSATGFVGRIGRVFAFPKGTHRAMFGAAHAPGAERGRQKGIL